MIISLNWLKKFTDINIPVDELAKLIGSRLVEIEKIDNIGEKYKDVLIVKVIDSKKMEGSDHLSICKIDDSGAVKDIERDENGYIQVVCGAPNMRSGLLVTWLPPKSIVPSTFNDAEQFTLDTRNLRGFLSNGMIASAKELDISDDHTGILEITDDIKPGTKFSEAYELDDYLLDIENKSLTHRPDCFGIIGFAREISAICGNKFSTPDWLKNISMNNNKSYDLSINVKIDDSNLSSRYQAVIMDDIKLSTKSPLMVQTYLSRVGVRPINAIVDVTNYLMLLTGQPLHAFDYDKLKKLNADNNVEIHVRSGRDGEKLELLNGKVIELTNDDIVIASADQPIALAGAMGGVSTAIDDSTNSIVIESATFNLYSLRATQMRHGIFSEAITRFTKGQPASLTNPVINNAIQMITEFTNAKQASSVYDDYVIKQDEINIQINASKINEILGSNFNKDEITNILNSIEFDLIKKSNDISNVIVPYWRCDIHILEDIVEEIGRIGGFDNINPTLPTRKFTAIKPVDFDSFRSKIRKILVRAGANETLLYSFIHGDILKKAGLDINNSYKIINSISPDLQYYRQTLSPTLLGSAYLNTKQGFDEFAIFEINKVHKKSDGLTNEGVPNESNSLALVFTNKFSKNSAPYYQAKRIVEYLCESLGIELKYKLIDDENPETAIFEKRRSAIIVDKKFEQKIGIVGEYKSSIIKSFKLSEYSSGFEVDINSIFDIYKKLGSNYKQQSKYPSTERDICFKVINNINYDQIINEIENTILQSDISMTILPVDIYHAKGSDTKNITIRVKLNSTEHTLTSDEVTEVINKISQNVISKTNASVV